MFSRFLSSRRSGSMFPLLAPSKSLLRMSMPDLGGFLSNLKRERDEDKTERASASSSSLKRRKTDTFKPLNAVN